MLTEFAENHPDETKQTNKSFAFLDLLIYRIRSDHHVVRGTAEARQAHPHPYGRWCVIELSGSTSCVKEGLKPVKNAAAPVLQPGQQRSSCRRLVAVSQRPLWLTRSLSYKLKPRRGSGSRKEIN